MPQVIKLNQHIYSLLIEKECNSFTIIELRNELLSVTDTYQDIDEARKLIYRQMTALERKELLKTKGAGRNKKSTLKLICLIAQRLWLNRLSLTKRN